MLAYSPFCETHSNTDEANDVSAGHLVVFDDLTDQLLSQVKLFLHLAGIPAGFDVARVVGQDLHQQNGFLFAERSGQVIAQLRVAGTGPAVDRV